MRCNESSYNFIATIAMLLLLLIAAFSSFAEWKAAIAGRYVIAIALLTLFLTVGAACAGSLVSVHGQAERR